MPDFNNSCKSLALCHLGLFKLLVLSCAEGQVSPNSELLRGGSSISTCPFLVFSLTNPEKYLHPNNFSKTKLLQPARQLISKCSNCMLDDHICLFFRPKLSSCLLPG